MTAVDHLLLVAEFFIVRLGLPLVVIIGIGYAVYKPAGQSQAKAHKPAPPAQPVDIIPFPNPTVAYRPPAWNIKPILLQQPG